MAFKATVTTEVEHCSMCPYSDLVDYPSLVKDVINIHCKKLKKNVHLNLEKLECCATGSKLTAKDNVPSDCPFPLDCDFYTITGSGDYIQTNFSHQ